MSDKICQAARKLTDRLAAYNLQRPEVAAFQAAVFYGLEVTELLRLVDEAEAVQPCGHPVACILQDAEGTSHCGWCEAEARGVEMGRKYSLCYLDYSIQLALVDQLQEAEAEAEGSIANARRWSAAWKRAAKRCREIALPAREALCSLMYITDEQRCKIERLEQVAEAARLVDAQFTGAAKWPTRGIEVAIGKLREALAALEEAGE